MKKFAVLDSESKVVNIILAPSESVAEQVTFSDCVHVPADAVVSLDYTWNGTNFIPVKPYESWILNTGTLLWEAPTPKPNDNNRYVWNEATLAWDEETRPE
jgi:hypothetical protein